MSELARLEVADGVATLRLDRPPVNALNQQLQEEIRTLAEEATERSDVAAVVVYGGERAFAAGADIKEMAAMSQADMAARAGALSSALGAVAAIPKPTVAAVTGYALGGGCELALACDLRYAADDAVLGQPEILLGVIPGAGGTQRLSRLVGPSRAKDLILTGRLVPAAEALTLGLVDRVVEGGGVLEAARAWAAQFVGGPALALRAAKQAVDEGLAVDLATGLELESRLFAELFGTEDRAVGMASFLEHGPGRAHFTGR